MVNWEATNLQRLLLDDGSAELCLAACRILAPRKTRATTKAMLVIPNLIENSVQKMPTKFSSRIHNHSWRKFGSHTKAAISRNATGMIHFSTVPNHAGGCPPSKSSGRLSRSCWSRWKRWIYVPVLLGACRLLLRCYFHSRFEL